MSGDRHASRGIVSSLVFTPNSFLTRYGPLLAWIVFIFVSSTGSFSASNTSRIIRPLVLWLFPETSEASLLQIHFAVRKLAHFTEYAILALLASRAFLTTASLNIQRKWSVLAALLVVACALLDEYHQSFVQSRTGTIYDSLIDIFGGVTAIAVVALWRRRRSEMRDRDRDKG
jgi:VanZ family protein